jgi:hypothetical protein
MRSAILIAIIWILAGCAQPYDASKCNAQFASWETKASSLTIGTSTKDDVMLAMGHVDYPIQITYQNTNYGQILAYAVHSTTEGELPTYCGKFKVTLKNDVLNPVTLPDGKTYPAFKPERAYY